MDTTEFISLLGIVGGIVGTLLGTVGGTWLQFLMERRRWRRDDQTRFRSELYKACMDFYYHATVAITIATVPGEDPTDKELFGSNIDAHLEATIVNRSRIEMLGGPSLRHSARVFYDAVIAAAVAEEGRFDDETVERAKSARRSFIEAARAELGVTIQR